jgi:flavin reductase (DIM6/NTAB) family NADH-FMN oxidoreductase RutF
MGMINRRTANSWVGKQRTDSGVLSGAAYDDPMRSRATAVDDGSGPKHRLRARVAFDATTMDRLDRYKLLSGLVVPRPIGWIGTRGPSGNNLAPFSFFNLVVGTPPILLFCPDMSHRSKDSLVNARASGVFTVNVATDDLAEAMNVTSGEYPPEVDEFVLAGLTPVDGEVVAAPMVGEAVAGFECRVTDIHEVGPGPAASVVFGEVLRIHVDESVLDGTRVRFDKLGAIGRLAGDWYARTTDLFEMKRP